MSTTFEYNVPDQTPPSPTKSNQSSNYSIDPDESTEAFYLILLQSPEFNSIEVQNLINRLLELKIKKSLEKELVVLDGELRDEFKTRSRSIKGDFMARIVDFSDPNAVEDEEETEGHQEEMLVPTILSDVDGQIKMVERVDDLVEREFTARIKEAKSLLINLVSSREKFELEIFLGELVSCE